MQYVAKWEVSGLTPRVAISQSPYDRDATAALQRAASHMQRARELGADLIVFPEWFLGLNPPEPMPSRALRVLADAARRHGVGVVTGTLRVLDPATSAKQQRALVLDQDGAVLGSQAKCDLDPPERPWFEAGEGIEAIPTRWGRVVLLLGPDALAPARWAECRRTGPALVVMATASKTAAEHRAVEDLALARSLDSSAVVVVVPLLGRFGGAFHVGAAQGFHRGRPLSASGSGEPVVLASGADSAPVELGVLDVCSWAPAHATALGDVALGPDDLRRPLAERRVLLDWAALAAPDPLAAGRTLLSLAEDSPRLAALAPAHPDHPRALEALLAEGAAGAFAWPAVAGRRADDPTFRAVVGLLARYRRPLAVRIGPGPAPLYLSHPEDWDASLILHPDVPVVLVSSGVREPFLAEALTLATCRANVWLELSQAPESFWEEARRTVGSHRLLFGSGGVPGAFAPEWARFQAWGAARGLTAEEVHAIAADNARALFFPLPHRAELAPPAEAGV